MSALAVPPSADRRNVMVGLEHLTDKVLDCDRTRVRMDSASFFAEHGAWTRVPRLVLGTRSAYDPAHRRKYICWRDWSVGTHELARPYLRWIHEQQRAGHKRSMLYRRVPWRTEQLGMLDLPHPLYYAGAGVEGDLAYVDISACYFQLYRPATLDLHFDPARGQLGCGQIEWLEPDLLADSKGLRNALIGVCRAQTIVEARFGQVTQRATHNRFLAPCLWGYLMHTLHAVMREAIDRFDACYVHTDGLIVPAENAPALIDWLAQEWRLESRVKVQGPGRVWGLGGYEIGEHRTRTAVERGRPICNLIDLDPEMHHNLRRWRGWLLDRPKGGGV